MGKDVKVRFIASDEVSATLRGIHGRLQGFSKDVTKIAAGIGLADSFKRLGKAIKGAIEDAAAAYPKLGTEFAKVTHGFTEFRIQAGAAFLEVLRPIVPQITAILGWATKLATQIPDAFDGFRIVLTEISAWFQSIPAKAELMFGKLEQKAAAFLGGAASGVLSFWGIGSGPELAARLMVHSEMVIASAQRTLAGIEAATDRTIAKYGGSHGYGRRAPTAAEQAALDKARAEAEQALINRQVPLKPTVIDPRKVVRTDKLGLDKFTGDLGSMTPSGARYDAMDAYAAGLEKVLGPLGDVLTSSQELHATLGEMAGLASGELTDAYSTFFAQMGTGEATMAGFGKATVKALAGAAVSEGKLGMAKGFAKIAEGLFPPNPPLLASGAKMVATNAALIALASALSGGGGGPASSRGGYGGSGSLSGAQVAQTGQAVAARGTLTVTMPRNAILRADSPEWQEFMAETMKQGQGRNVEFRYT